MEENLESRSEWIGRQIVDIAYQIHYHLGPGLLESVYEKVFCYELRKRDIPYECQKRLPIIYDDVEFADALKLDLIIEDLVIVELKARENFHPVWKAQLLSYLKLTDKKLGFIINFSVPLIKQGIKRMVN